MKKVEDKLIPKTEDEFDAEDIKKVENYAKAINMLYCAVNPNDYRKISCCSTAKEMWDKLEVTYEGTDQVREAKIDFLTQECEMFRMKEHENIDNMFDRFSKIVNDLHALKKTYTDRDLRKGITLKATKEPTMNDSSDDDEVKLVMKKFCKLLRNKEKVEDGPVCYGCSEAGNIKNKCPRNGRNTRHFKKQRAYISWGGDSGDESTDQDEDKTANLCLMAHEDQTDNEQEDIGFPSDVWTYPSLGVRPSAPLPWARLGTCGIQQVGKRTMEPDPDDWVIGAADERHLREELPVADSPIAVVTRHSSVVLLSPLPIFDSATPSPEILNRREPETPTPSIPIESDWIRAQLRKPKLDMEENLEELEKMEKDLKNANIDDDLIFVTE
ncbi:unnamed protein product [Cuscuta campestris]|uniref:CCHC-type domain-containing protein n=1 Tax=Cuscuta campestris TaxID=132261 RepID=A0A484KZV1_9ASTE|nr:unnamed protein product [Cuscuta campestris]